MPGLQRGRISRLEFEDFRAEAHVIRSYSMLRFIWSGTVWFRLRLCEAMSLAQLGVLIWQPFRCICNRRSPYHLTC